MATSTDAVHREPAGFVLTTTCIAYNSTRRNCRRLLQQFLFASNLIVSRRCIWSLVPTACLPMVLCLPSPRRCCSLIFLLLSGFAGTAPGVAGFQPPSTSRWSVRRRTTRSAPRPAPAQRRDANPLGTRASPSARRSSRTQLHQAAALAAMDSFFQSFPYAAAALTCGFKASTADLVAQNRSYRKRNEKEALKARQQQQQEVSSAGAAAVALEPPKQTTDVKRTVAFLLYGALYQGMAQEFIYNHLYPTIFGSGTTITVVLSKVLFDLCVQTTLVTLPIAYLTKALIYNYSAKEALRRYWDDIRNHGLLKKYFLLWGPVQCITFSVVPEHYRVAFIACVSFFWLIILSTIASKSRKPPKEAVAAEEELALVVVDDEDIPECEFVDGLTCNVDG